MFCDAHWTQQHATPLSHAQSTVTNNRSTGGSGNHHQQRPQVAKTNIKSAKQPTEYWGSLPKKFQI